MSNSLDTLAHLPAGTLVLQAGDTEFEVFGVDISDHYLITLDHTTQSITDCIFLADSRFRLHTPDVRRHSTPDAQ